MLGSCVMIVKAKAVLVFLVSSVLLSALLTHSASAQQFLISISNPPTQVDATAAGDSQFWVNAGVLQQPGPDIPISLRATVLSISAGDSVRLFTRGDDPAVRANTGTLSAVISWEVFDRNTGLPIFGNPDFLITDIDGRNGIPIESVSAACAGLNSFETNGEFDPFNDGCNANFDARCDTNIRVSESGGAILAEGTQGQNSSQQEGYIQYNWVNRSEWTVSYFATTPGRVYNHDADGDIDFDGTRVEIALVDLATIKGVTSTSLTAPEQGQEITFQIDLSNDGPENATNANLQDLLPAGLQYVSDTTTSGTYNSVTGEWTGVNVAVGATETLTITALVTAPAGTTITNTSTTALADESICSSRDSLEFTFVVAQTPAPSLEIDKSVSAATSLAQAGDVITYEYLVRNTGNVTINGVTPVDVGPTFNGQSGTSPTGLSGFSPVSVALTPGGSQVFTATYALTQTDINNLAQSADPLTAIVNSATATGQFTPLTGAAQTINASASTATTGLAPAPSLSVDKRVSTATAFSAANDVITYEYEIRNTGNIAMENVTPTDVGPTFNGQPATNALSAFTPAPTTLAPNQNQVFTATYTLAQADIENIASASDPLTAINNTASATGDPLGAATLAPVTPDTVDTGLSLTPSLSVAKSVSSATTFAGAGDVITYQYEVQNTGNVMITSVAPTDVGPTFNGALATNSLSAFTPVSVSLAPNSSQIFTATYLLDQVDVDNLFSASDPTTAIANTASAQGVPSGGVLAPVTDSTATTGFTSVASLGIVKTAGAPSVGAGLNPTATDAGDTIAYSFEVTNTGDVTVTGVAVNDLGLTFNAVAGTGSLSAINCPLSTLTPQQTTTCTATYTLTQMDVDNAVAGGTDSIVNSANATGQDPENNPVTSADDTVLSSVTADSSINIAKSAGAPTVVLGADSTIVDPDDTISYSVLIENTGNTTLTSVTIVDSLINLTCPSTTVAGNAFANDGTDSLSVGDSITCTGVYPLLQNDLNNGGVTNTAQVSAFDPSGGVIADNDAVNSGFTQQTAIALTKSASQLPTNPSVNDVIDYRFELTNTGNVTLTAPQVNDPNCQTPASPLTFTNGFVSGDGVTVGALDAGERWVFECQYEITQIDIDLGEISNTANATGTPPTGSGLELGLVWRRQRALPAIWQKHNKMRLCLWLKLLHCRPLRRASYQPSPMKVIPFHTPLIWKTLAMLRSPMWW